VIGRFNGLGTNSVLFDLIKTAGVVTKFPGKEKESLEVFK
jgi:hypothetical protein